MVSLTDVGVLTGIKAYFDAAQRMWIDAVTRKMYITGGVGSTGNEGFGEAYSLPNISAYSETCAVLMFITLNHRMFLATGDSRYIDVMERGMYARALKHRLSPFTLVGATTRPGMLSAPLRERFGIFHHLDFYSEAELTRIVLRSAEILGAKVEPGGAGEIARRARGTPRIVNRLLRRVRDYAQVAGDGIITAAIARDALDKEGVDGRGLDRLDRRFLTAIVEHYGGGPVGIEAVAATINDEAESLTEMVEPYLLKIGFVVRTPTGRRVTREAYLHLERQPPATQGGQGGLFE